MATLGSLILFWFLVHIHAKKNPEFLRDSPGSITILCSHANSISPAVSRCGTRIKKEEIISDLFVHLQNIAANINLFFVAKQIYFQKYFHACRKPLPGAPFH